MKLTATTFTTRSKKRQELDATVVCIDQTRKPVQVEPRTAWFPRGTRPAVELSGQHDWTCLLGAITVLGDRFFSRFEEYATGEHAKHFSLTLCEDIREDLIIVLDRAPYFQASVVTGRQVRDDLTLVRLPAYSPELNPVEECWRLLQNALGNRLFKSLAELNSAIDTALDHLSIPDMSNYF